MTSIEVSSSGQPADELLALAVGGCRQHLDADVIQAVGLADAQVGDLLVRAAAVRVDVPVQRDCATRVGVIAARGQQRGRQSGDSRPKSDGPAQVS